MAAYSDSLHSVQAEVSRMTKVQKLAVLLVMLGPDAAAQILKCLEPADLEAVSLEMTRLPLISYEVQTEILREFSNVALEASTGVCGSIEFTQEVLERGVGSFRASDILGRIVPHRPPVTAMQSILDMDPRPLANLLKHEQPQAIALVTSYLPPDKSSRVLFLLPEFLREEVIERLATLGPTPVEVVERVANLLNQKLSGNRPTRAPSQTGGVKSAADVLNALDRDLSKTILLSLEGRNPELSQAIRNKMFTFEDLVRLDTSSLQKILREVDLRDLALALKNASETLKKKLLGCISKRAAETVNEEISFMGAIKAKESEAAKVRIIEVLRRLETEGEIDLNEVQENARHEAVA